MFQAYSSKATLLTIEEDDDFGHHLICNLNPEWSDHYLPYNNLKKSLRSIRENIPTDLQHQVLEKEIPAGKLFLETLHKSMESAEHFYNNQLKIISVNLEFITDEAHDPQNDTKKMTEIKRKLISLYIQINNLKIFASLNYTAISKILKKHDKYLPSYPIKTVFMQERVSSKSMYTTQDELYKELTKIRNLFSELFFDGNRQTGEEFLEDAYKQDQRSKERRGPEGILTKKCFIIDMDGVVYHGERLLPGVIEFVEWLQKEKKKYLFLTNGSTKTPQEIQAKLLRLGLKVPDNVFMTSAIATAKFLQSQHPSGSAFVVGDNGLVQALKDVGFTITDENPSYVVVGETKNWNFELVEKAINLVYKGAKLIGTNCDAVDNGTTGYSPAGGALTAPIEVATGQKAYFVGKPNALMFRTALAKLDCHSSEAVMIGDRMDTDIQGGMEAGMDTILVLSGICKLEDLNKFSFRPTHILKGVFEIQNILNVDQ